MTEQRTAEWHEARKGRVTGSMVGAILGLSPYMTRGGAMRSMVREALGLENEFTGNVATEWGTYNEAGAIVDFTMQTEISVEPCGFYPYEDWLGASPDGLTSDGGLLEVKCPFYIRNDPAPIFKTIFEQPHYHAQMQIQMFVTSRLHCWFFQWTPHGNLLRKVDYNPHWIDENLPKLAQFYAQYLDEVKEPEDHIAPLRVELDTPEAYRIMREYDELCEQIDNATERKKEVLGELVAMAGGKNALIAGRKLTQTNREGAISYAKAIKAIAPDADLEPYRGKPSSFWSVK